MYDTVHCLKAMKNFSIEIIDIVLDFHWTSQYLKSI